MKRKIFLRGLFGLPIGMTIGTIINISISAFRDGGQFIPCTPQFIELIGSEIGAVALQALLSALIGAAFAAGSVIWEMDSWSIARQCGVYFLITALVMLPIAYIAGWMEHSVSGFLIYLGIFTGMFAVTWISQYLALRNKIKKLNSGIAAPSDD